jgi:TonB family protein
LRSPIIIRIFKDSKMLEVKQFERDQIIFGQDADVQVELNDEDVSAIHCLIELRDSGYYVCDLGSQTGTFKNGQQILDEPISSGDQIRIGPYTIHFFVGVPKPKGPPNVVPTPGVETPSNNVLAPTAKNKVVAKVPAMPPPPASVSAPTPIPKVVVPPAPKLPETAKVEPSQPESTKSKNIFKSNKKGRKTFAPPSQNQDLKSVLGPGKGASVEVIVAWKERVLSTVTFGPNESAVIGSSNSATVQIPQGFIRGDLPFLVNSNGCTVAIPSEGLAECMGSGREAVSGSVKLEQNELLCISFSNGLLQVFVRYTAALKKPLLMPLLDFTSGELTAIIVSILATALTALYVSLYTPPPSDEQKEEDTVRLAQFVYNRPKDSPSTPEVAKSTEPIPTPVPTPTPPPKKVQVTDKKQPETPKGVKESTAPAKQRPTTKANEVRANPAKVDRPKKFTSVKQGGAVKTSDTEGANAQAPKDVNKTGLLSAFGGGGNRKNLDQAYSGSGDLLGMANEATGKAGQKDDRSGDDLGSKFKDTGAGGKGTATAGISGVGTKGRSSGQSAYGDVGFGGKGAVRIEAAGTEAEFIGKIDREAVRRAVRALLPLIQNCYNKSLNMKRDLEGKVIIKFVIAEQGRIQSAVVKSSTMGSSDVEGCVARTIRNGGGFPEPPPGTIAEVDYPFLFSPPN